MGALQAASWRLPGALWVGVSFSQKLADPGGKMGLPSENKAPSAKSRTVPRRRLAQPSRRGWQGAEMMRSPRNMHFCGGALGQVEDEGTPLVGCGKEVHGNPKKILTIFPCVYRCSSVGTVAHGCIHA